MLRNRGGVWWLDIPASVAGRRVRESTHTADKRLAQKVHDKRMAEYLLGTREATTPTLAATWDKAYRTHYVPNCARSLPAIAGNYRAIEGILGGDTRLAAITAPVVAALVDTLRSRGDTNGTVNRKLAVLSKLLTLAVRWGDLGAKPHIPFLQERRGRVRVLTEQEYAALQRAAVDAGDYAMDRLMAVLWNTGMRLSEALRVRLADVHNGTVALWDTKNGSFRTLPVSRAIAGLLIAGFGGMTKDKACRRFAKLRESAGLGDDVSLHVFRHTVATRLARAGCDVHRIQKWMGHSDIKTTLIYVHLSGRDLADMGCDQNVPNVGMNLPNVGLSETQRGNDYRQLGGAKVAELVDALDLGSHPYGDKSMT